MALGQIIVRQLELEDRGTVLERWLAHHLAEAIAEAGQAVGPARAAPEARAVDLILKVWAHRRALPEPVDPLGGYRKAIEVLGRLAPEANPWARYRQPDSYDNLLHEMFELLSGVVLDGLLLTHVSRARPITAEESEGLEEEEAYLQSVFEHWMPFFPRPQSGSGIEFEPSEAGTAEGSRRDEESKQSGGSRDRENMSDEQTPPDEARLHAAIVADLERMQADLATLLTRWRESRPCEGEDEQSIEPAGGCEDATTAGSPGAVGKGEFNREEREADPGNEESTRANHHHSFWSSLSLDELADVQRVAPVEDPEAITALWPSDENPDELLEHVLAERAARRQVAGSGPDR